MNIKKFFAPVTIIAFIVAIVVFLKNAWFTDDACILFRSLEQLFAGNGPNWNAHERVQVYTSPLWYFMLAGVRIFTENYYLSTILLSFLLWVSTLLVIRIILEDDIRFLLASLIFVGSNGFYDYTSSGLENVLAYFLISLFLLFYWRLFSQSEESQNRQKAERWYLTILMLLFGLLLLVRYDLVTILLPAMLYLVYSYWTVFSLKKWIGISVLAAIPFVSFTIFSVIYYGFPLPNTAYAKVFNGIARIELLKQGLKYPYVSLCYDTLTAIIILLAIVIGFSGLAKKQARFLALGLLTNLLYVVYVGGDFMQGRFLSYSILISVVILMLTFEFNFRNKYSILAFSIIGLYLVFYPHTPLNSSLTYRNRDSNFGIADERGFYFHGTSLNSYLKWDRETELLPMVRTAWKGNKFKQSEEKVRVYHIIGYFGLYAGTDKIVVDPMALADPFLARLPTAGRWRIGHFQRDIPEGYIDTLITGQNMIEDPQLHEYYDYLRLVTQSEDLFSPERLKMIFYLNTGKYDHLLPGN